MKELPTKTIERAIKGPRDHDGTRRAFERLYRQYGSPIERAVSRAARGRTREMDAQEIRQEVWCRLLDDDRRRLRAYDSRRGPFGMYLTYIAFYEALAVIRLRRMQPSGERLDLSGDEEFVDEGAFRFVAELAQNDFLHKLLDEAAVQISADAYKVLIEVLLHGRTCRELAEELGVKENTIAQRKKRLMRRLQDIKEQVLFESTIPSSRGEVAVRALFALIPIILSMTIEG